MLFAPLAVLAACHDAPTVSAPAQSPVTGIAQSARGLHSGEVPFYCTLGRHAPSSLGGWQTRLGTLFVPRAEMDQGGRVVRYEYRRSFPDGRPLTTASCVVPYTEGALRRVDRTFGVENGGGADQFRARQEKITIQVCEGSSGCVLDPVVVIAPPPEPSDLPPCPGCEAPFPVSPRPGGGGDGGGSGLEGSDSEEGVVTFTVCMVVKLGAGGWSAIGGTAVTAYMAWDARNNSRAAYDAWAGYRQNVENGVIQYDVHINDLYYKRWKDAEGQEKAMYVGTAVAGVWASLAIFEAAVACAPYAAAPV